jgi:hypothetical protein
MVLSFRKLLYLRFAITEVGIYNSHFLFIPIVCRYLKKNVIIAPSRSSLILTKTVNFMNLRAIFHCFFILFFSASHAQSLKPKSLVENARSSFQQAEVKLFNLSSERNSIKIPDEIKEYSILSIDKRAIQSLTQSRSPFISMKIPQNGRNDISLELVEVNPFSEDFILRTAPSMQIVSFNHGKHYRGIVKGQERSIAAISIFDDQIVGMISHPSATGNLVIGRLENAEQHILYQDDQIADKKKASCQTTDDMKSYTDDELRHSNSGTRALTDCVKLYLEVDYDIYTSKGSSITNVNNYVAGIFNQVNTLYANEQINTVVSEILVWTTPSPYNSTSSDGMLTAFGNQRQGFNGDLAMLLSYKASGGIAWVNGLCRTNPDYSMSYSGIQSTYQNVPTYSWTVEVCTHEFGHLFGSQHTHACVWNGNNTAIDGCYTPEGSCSNPGLPPAATGGTIMSYCHLTSVGIKFSNGFGTQPGNVMRNRVSASTCLQACNGGGGGGGTQCNEVSLTLELRTDTYANETTWEIKNSAGVIVSAGGPYSSGNTLHNISLCLPAGCNYTFTIKDLYGDGICCAYGSGSYTLKQGTNTIITGGQFGASETKSFCTSGSAASSLNLSTATGSAGSTEGAASVGVTSNVSWTAISNAASWCTVTPASGSNNGTLSINYTSNTATTSRSATVTVTGGGITKTYLLTQSGSTPASTLNLSVASGNAGAAAGAASVGVTSNVSWTATSNAASWCTVTPASGSNNGTLSINYTSNTATTSRSATVTVTGGDITKTYLLTQSGSTPASTLNLSVASGNAGAAAGSASVGVTSNVSWTAISNAASWCTVTPASGSNNGTLSINYTSNTATTSRSATVTVTGGDITKTYLLTQSGSTPASTLNLSVASGNAGAAAGSASVGVTSNVSWTATSNAASWCTVTPASGSNNGTLSINYTSNTATTSRSATVTVTGGDITKTYLLTQSGSTPASTLNLSVASGNAGAAAGAASVGVTSNVSWTATSNAASWCTVTPASGSNNGTLSINYTSNTATTSRSATVTVTGGGITKNYILTQAVSTAPTCNDGIQNGNETGVDCGGSCPACGSCVSIVLEIRTDQYPSEISWNIKNSTGAIAVSGGNYAASHTVHAHAHCLPVGCYTLNLLDGYGDGILAPGYYKITQGTTILVNNEAYGLSKTVNFCVGSSSNSQLTLSNSTGSAGAVSGVASVGISSNVSWTASSNATSWCTVTPATGSNNGTLNVNYTSNTTTVSRSSTITVEGGGITKTYVLTQTGIATPTCSDGIQNGSETGVDCGGSCAPCSSGGSVVLSGNYFEEGWDGWLDGGSDCFRYQGSFSPEGQYSIRIRDNSGTESTMTSPVYNLTPYSSVSIEFKFRAVGMETGEDFWLRYFNGTTWSTVGTFISGSSFANNQLYTINITLTGQFPSNAKFSFQCDASENDDEVFIDAVIIKGNTGSNLIEELISIKSENNIVLADERINDMSLSPNPAENTVQIKLSETPKSIKIFNVSGQLIQMPVDIEQSIMDVSLLKSGIYFIQAETEEEVYTQKLIKI